MGKDKDTLQRISKDLYYEVSHLIELAAILTEEKDNIKMHAFLESLLIHSRNVFYFLYNDENPKYKDDVLSIHFIQLDEWNEFRNSQINLEIFKGFRQRIAKEIAHLTYSRLEKNSENIKWDIRFVVPLIKGIDKFIELAEKDLLHSDWNNYQFLKKKLSAVILNKTFTQLAYSTH